ncbi:hypothetical protein [Fusobacterium necrogenes]|uniref:hypothetical protein n=1 Tax=Fusobacterium necrogenes TaxID=858 RepID=UPI00255D017F|nr:hypothetical protein [Fusobacterium necrogenes]
MYFLLDKDYAVNNVTRCIGISQKGFTQEDIESAKLKFNSKDVVIYEGDDIPHYIEYDAVTNTIKEGVAPIPVEDIHVISEDVDDIKLFDDEVKISKDIFYFYIDKIIADTEHISENLATFNQPLLNPDKYLGKESYLIKGKEMPYYITIENGSVREATEYERYKRGQYILRENEVEYNNNLITLEEGWYIQDNELIKIEKPLDMVKSVFNKETCKWEETATEEEIIKYIGNIVTDLLYEALTIGCEVTIKEEKHQQSLSDDKRKALNERISGFNLAQELGSPITQVAWPFKDDGTDTVIMSVDEFKQMALYCLGYGEKCYLAAELLKAKRKVNPTIEDFYTELANVGSISLENL